MPRTRYTRDAKHFVVVTSFAWLGRPFEEGVPFPWEELGVSELQRRELWVANKIAVAPAPQPASPPPGPEQTSPETDTAAEVDQVAGVDLTLTAEIADGAKAQGRKRRGAATAGA